MAKIRKTKTWESKKKKLLGVEIDRTLRFDKYIGSLCKKTEKKLFVLEKLSNFILQIWKGFCWKNSLNLSMIIAF